MPPVLGDSSFPGLAGSARVGLGTGELPSKPPLAARGAGGQSRREQARTEREVETGVAEAVGEGAGHSGGRGALCVGMGVQREIPQGQKSRTESKMEEVSWQTRVATTRCQGTSRWRF